MPPVKNKEDTWKASELEKHIRAAKDDKGSTKSRKHDDEKEKSEKKHRDSKDKKHRDDSERRHRDDKDRRHHDDGERRHRDERDRRHHDEGERRHRDEKERRHRDDSERKHRDDDRGHRDEDRRQRDEDRRDKSKPPKSREGKEEAEKRSSSKHRDENDEERRRRREERKRETEESGGGDREHRKQRDRGDREDDGKRHGDRDDRDKKKDKERDEKRDERKEREQAKEESESKSRRREDKERSKDSDSERRHRRHKDNDDKGDSGSKHRRHRDRDREDEDTRRDADGQRRRRQEKEAAASMDGEKERKREKSEKGDKEERRKKHSEPEERSYSNEYEDDFEAYEDDFEPEPADSISGEEDDEPRVISKSQKHPIDRNRGRGDDDSRGEMDDILKALDEENKRLLSSHKVIEEERRHKQKKDLNLADGHTFINFVSAKQRTVTHQASKQMRKRATYLMKLIALDVVSYDLFEQHSEREYDKFIRSYGRTNATQKYVQTNEDSIEAEVQTEEMTFREKWSQHPPEGGISASGGDGGNVDSGHLDKLSQKIPWDIALDQGIRVIETLLEENRMENMHKNVGHKQSNIVVSEAFVELNVPSILEGRHVTFSQFSPDHNHLLVAVYSPLDEKLEQPNPLQRKGVVCVWNVYDSSRPQKVLLCPSQPLCSCFSPTKPTLVFAGLNDGVVVMWDLREPNQQHKLVVYDKCEYILRNPTYNTAMPYMHDSHNSPVIRIAPLVSNAAKSGPSLNSADEECLSYQLASLEQNSVIVLWVVVELAKPDPIGSTADFGLREGGRVKLIKSSVIKLENPRGFSVRNSVLETMFECRDLQVSPEDSSRIFVATSATGCVFQTSRNGSRLSPKAFRPKSDYPFDVTSFDFSPFLSSIFLAGGSDGSLRLYRVDMSHPLVTWYDATDGRSVRMVRWCRSRPSVFFVLDDDSFIYIWDLHMEDSSALKKERIANCRVTSICLSNDHSATGQGLPDRPPQMVVFLENGVAEAHIIKREFSALMPEERRQFSAFIDKAIL